MNSLLDQLSLWLPVSIVTFFLTSYYGLHIENQYRKEFLKELTSPLLSIPSILVSFILFLAGYWLTKERYVAGVLPALALAAASLRSVWTIDRLLLLIPDRLQLLGLLSGIWFIAIQILSGEPFAEVMMSLGFGLGMVGLLWILSVIYLRLRGSVGFGFGDIKLLGWLAFFVGPRMADLVLFAIGFGILQLALTSILKSMETKELALPKIQDAFAFGPSIVLGFVVMQLMHFS